MLFVSAICLAGPKQPIPVPSYLDVNVKTITANEWKYFIGEVKPKKELEHPAKRVSASIDLNAEKNKQRRKYRNCPRRTFEVVPCIFVAKKN